MPGYYLARTTRKLPLRGWVVVQLTGALLAILIAASTASAQTQQDTTHVSAAHSHGHPKGMGHEHGPSVTAEPLGPGSDPVLLTGMGDHSMARVSDDALAQAYFDQSLMLAYGFNHPEAAVSFAHAAALDERCVLCPWGKALVLGPNINALMEPSDHEAAYQASRAAAARLGPKSTALERDLVNALLTRYVAEPPAGRSGLDLSYANAMRKVAAKHPANADVQALFADALMTTMPWDYWLADGSPKPATLEVKAALEAALDNDVRHPLANHLWIHLWEKHEPLKAVPAAERLESLAPAAGHLVHMPAHIYIRVGRYADAVIANQRAIVADQAYLAQSGTEGLYRIGYVPHNVHFLWAAATLAGRSRAALDAADRLGGQVDTSLLTVPGLDAILQDYWIAPLLARVRFGHWEEILAWPEMEEDLLYPRGIRSYARAVALARTGKLDDARTELRTLSAIADDPRMTEFLVWGVNSGEIILSVAEKVARGEVLAAAGETDRAVAVLREATEIEAQILYQEPEAWHQPVRQVLGAVLLDAGRFQDAARAFREDLEKYPENGWSLWGLATALEALEQQADADLVWDRYEIAFRDADIDLTSSRF